MQLAIATNPQTKNPKNLWQMLEQKERENEGKGYIDAGFDTAGFEAFKSKLKRQSSGIVIK